MLKECNYYKFIAIILISLFVFSWDLLSHYIDIVEILLVFIFTRDHSWGRNGRLGYLVLENCPVVVLFLEITKSLLWQTISHTDIYPCGWKYSINFAQYLVSVGSGPISAQYWVNCTLINYCIECAIFILETSCIHLLKRQVRTLLLVQFLHLLYNSKWDVHVRNVLVAIFVHLFT